MTASHTLNWVVQTLVKWSDLITKMLKLTQNMNLLFRTCGLSCESSMPKLQKQRHEMTISLVSWAKAFSWKACHQWCYVWGAHPSSGRVGRPREALQSHLVLKGCGWDDLSRRHAGHTLHGFVFGHLVLLEDNNMRNIINVHPIQL